MKSQRGKEVARASLGEVALRLQVMLLRGFLNNLCDELKRFAAVLEEVEEQVDAPAVRSGVNFYADVRNYETALIERALRYCKGNQREAAALLMLKPTTLGQKIKRLKISTDNYTSSHPSARGSQTTPPDSHELVGTTAPTPKD